MTLTRQVAGERRCEFQGCLLLFWQIWAIKVSYFPFSTGKRTSPYTPICSCKLKKQNSPSQFSTETTSTGRIPTKIIDFEMYERWPFEKIAFLWFLLGKFASDIYHFLCLSLCDFSMGKQQKLNFLKRTRFVGFNFGLFGKFWIRNE